MNLEAVIVSSIFVLGSTDLDSLKAARAIINKS